MFKNDPLDKTKAGASDLIFIAKRQLDSKVSAVRQGEKIIMGAQRRSGSL